MLRGCDATRGGVGGRIFFQREFTHGFVCDELMREQLDWWMAVTCSDQRVFRVCVHELRESRVDKACVRISRLSSVSKTSVGAYTFSENEAVHYGGHAGCRVAYVNDQRGTFPCGKSSRGSFLSPPPGKVSKTIDRQRREVSDGRV